MQKHCFAVDSTRFAHFLHSFVENLLNYKKWPMLEIISLYNSYVYSVNTMQKWENYVITYQKLYAFNSSLKYALH